MLSIYQRLMITLLHHYGYGLAYHGTMKMLFNQRDMPMCVCVWLSNSNWMEWLTGNFVTPLSDLRSSFDIRQWCVDGFVNSVIIKMTYLRHININVTFYAATFAIWAWHGNFIMHYLPCNDMVITSIVCTCIYIGT